MAAGHMVSVLPYLQRQDVLFEPADDNGNAVARAHSLIARQGMGQDQSAVRARDVLDHLAERIPDPGKHFTAVYVIARTLGEVDQPAAVGDHLPGEWMPSDFAIVSCGIAPAVIILTCAMTLQIRRAAA